MNRTILHTAGLICMVLLGILMPKLQLLAQSSPPADPGVNWIMITFSETPTNVTVEKTPLRYNKSFAISFHNDDGIADIYTEGYPFFTGNPVGNSTFPGLFFTDGCGNDVAFKLSSNLYSFNGISGPDMHFPGNGYGVVTWPQLHEMYTNGCGIYNHGISGDASTDNAFMHYSIARNESYIRRKLFETTPGGVQTRIFVNPNGNVAYSPVAFEQGYFAAFNQSSQGVIGNNGGDVNLYADWMIPTNLNRLIAENTNVMQLADNMFASSINGANFWAPIFTHSIVSQYPLADFHTDWNYIAETYGRDGLDKVWVATEEEIISYLRIRQATNISYGLAGNTLLITLSGDIPSDMRFYPLSLIVDADTPIASIQINGGINNTYNGIGDTLSLINLEWNGRYIPDIVTLADYYVSTAETTQAQYDCWIAMDYVYMISPGPERNALRDRLCAIENVTYDPGFCETCTFSLGNDTTICQFECVELAAPIAEGNTYLWSNDSTSQSITVCPSDTTEYWVQLTTIGGCIAADTIVVNVLPAPIFELGADVQTCIGENASITGPLNETYTYSWYANHELLSETTNELSFVVTDTTLIQLTILAENGCEASDSLTVFALNIPDIQITPAQTSLCFGGSVQLHLSTQNADDFHWWDGSTGQNITFVPTTADTTYHLWAMASNGYGCESADTAIVDVFDNPRFSLAISQGNDSLCAGESLTLSATIDNQVPVILLNWNDEEIIENPPAVNHKILTPEASAWYKVSIQSNNACLDSDSIYLFVQSPPSMSISNDTSICEFESFRLEAVGGQTCNWFVNGELIADTYTIDVSPTLTTTYIAIITGEAPLLCSTTDSVKVTVNPKPQLITTFADSTVCFGSGITLTASGAENYIWSNLKYTPSIDVVVEEPAVYSVIGSTQYGCSDTAEINLDIYPQTEVSFSGLLPVYCLSDPPTQLVGVPDGGLFTGPGMVAGQFDPSLAEEGTHLITYTITDQHNCISSYSLETNIFGGSALINLGPDSTICPDKFIMLDAGSGFSQYFWSTGATTQTIVISGNDYPTGTSREISVVGVLDGCTASGKMKLTIRNDCFIGIGETFEKQDVMVLPNPNNGTFTIYLAEDQLIQQIQIHDLGGKLVYEESLNEQRNSPKTIQLSSGLKGFFVLSIQTNDSFFTSKLIVP